MHRLTGEYECKVDAKGRLRIPSSLVRQLGSENLTFTINRGFEKHLILYPKTVWDRKAGEIDQLSMYQSRQRQALRFFYRGASELILDSSDRILLPKSLVSYAGIESDVVLFALQEQIEIWSKAEYEKMIAQEPEDFAQIADEIFGHSAGDGQ
jgi:MraZ protein